MMPFVKYESSTGFFGSPWRFLREVLGDLYEDLAYLSAVGRSSTNCCMIVQRLLHDHLPIDGWLRYQEEWCSASSRNR
ncbi:hypothetical protein F9Z97_06070 [Parabacteroides distasonis]|nr:hypothetical protein F9Z97_06070 [Parabacteroides distasonis]QCY55021.1 hypothetical protein FE931_02030 [Parabacteroides distasonis]REC37638.1 hypothetical protein CF162_04830 [Parabacteroides distasonis]